MIQTVKIERLRNVEFISFGKDVARLLENAGVETLGIESAFTPFKEEWESLSDYFLIQRGSELTDELVTLDNRRDDAIVGLIGLAESYLRHFSLDKRQAGEKIMLVFSKYGKGIHRQNFMAETETIRNIVDDFENNPPAKAALTFLGVADWLVELNEANDAFNQVYLQRVSAEGTKPEGSLVEKRKPCLELYRRLVKVMEARETLDPLPARASVISQINELIFKYNQLVMARLKTKSSEPEPEPGNEAA